MPKAESYGYEDTGRSIEYIVIHTDCFLKLHDDNNIMNNLRF